MKICFSLPEILENFGNFGYFSVISNKFSNFGQNHKNFNIKKKNIDVSPCCVVLNHSSVSAKIKTLIGFAHSCEIM